MERVSGYVLIGKLRARTMKEAARRTIALVRKYLENFRTSMAHVAQRDCNRIAKNVNTRPRKRLDYQTPEERFHAA